ncbi:transglycosylase family protein [Streptomyces sp. HPF1205]|uniref:transglycosylase family protein n=1 Tax=Streptomyces sp. HPF1205 TaxID=2873262 RepID=UPI0027DF6905|nr:transglycosylase family protein [Streptomyces sp. HPF1205]
MLTSGNGRHRRPRQAPAAVVTVAATGAGIALPLLGAAGAHAADNSTWDKVAACETGGLWSANTGNGFFGGLAITQDTWDEYGGDVYATRPDLASRSQQIAVAQKILADIGPDAWPGCEKKTGLFKDTAPPSVDPGDTATPSPAPSTPVPPAPTYTPPAVPGAPTVTVPGAEHTAPPATTPVSPTAPTGSTPTATPSSPSATPPATGSAAPGGPTAPAGDTPGSPAATGTAGSPGGTAAPGTSDTSGTPTTQDPTDPSATPSTGRHAKPYSPTIEQLAAADQATRTHIYSVAAVDDSAGVPGSGANANNGGEADTSSSSGTDSYTVDHGDSLSGIAATHHVEGGWRHLYDANHGAIGDDPNLIKPGQILNLG